MMPTGGTLARGVAALVGVALLVEAAVRVAGLVWHVDLGFGLWADRDLVRAATFFDRLPTAGAELSYGDGARIPGGAVYALMGLVQAV